MGEEMETDMYKKQMILQRIVCYAMLIAAALVFVYSLGIMTDMYDSKFAYYAEDIENPMVAGTEIYYIMQDFNKSLTTAGIMLILLAVTQLVFQNHNRRKYYIANYITVGANTIAVVGVSVWALNNIFTYREMYLEYKDKKYWWQMIQLLPSSYNQMRTVTLNYENLINIYYARRNHKLAEWHTLCDWILTLPCAKEWICVKE